MFMNRLSNRQTPSPRRRLRLQSDEPCRERLFVALAAFALTVLLIPGSVNAQQSPWTDADREAATLEGVAAESSDTLRTHRWDRDRTRLHFPLHPGRLAAANRFGAGAVARRLENRIRRLEQAYGQDSLILRRLGGRGGARFGIPPAAYKLPKACGVAEEAFETAYRAAAGKSDSGETAAWGAAKGWFAIDESPIMKIDVQEPEGLGGWQSVSRIQFMRNDDGLPGCMVERSPNPENRLQFSTSFSYNANGDLRQTQLHLSDDETDVPVYELSVTYDELGRPVLMRDVLFPLFEASQPDTIHTTLEWNGVVTVRSVTDGVDGTQDADTLHIEFTEGGQLEYRMYESFLEFDEQTFDTVRTRIWERRRQQSMQRVRDMISTMYHFYDLSPVEVEQAASAEAPYQNRERVRHRRTMRELQIDFDEWAPGGYWSTMERVGVSYLESEEPGWLVFEELTQPEVYMRHVINDAQVTSVASVQGPPAAFRLEANYPNPFNPSTVLPFTLERAADVRLDVLDELGRPIARVLDGPVQAGSHRVVFDADDYRLPGGVYLYRLVVDGREASRSMVLIK